MSQSILCVNVLDINCILKEFEINILIDISVFTGSGGLNKPVNHFFVFWIYNIHDF